MLRQSKFTQHAIAAVSRLAEVYGDAGTWLSAADIAETRNLRKPAAAKVLSVLAQGKLVDGSTGPGGGYRISRPPSAISLWDVVRLFEPERPMACPYGPGWCGHKAPCPLHDSFSTLRSKVEEYLRKTTFAVFVRNPSVGRRRAATARAVSQQKRLRKRAAR